MPTYEYRCNDCDHTFEEFQSITSDPLDACPVCNGTPRRLIGAGGGLIFKGSGFYITDYRSKSYQDKAKAESSNSSSSNSESKNSESKNSESKKSETKSKKPEKSTAKA